MSFKRQYIKLDLDVYVGIYNFLDKEYNYLLELNEILKIKYTKQYSNKKGVSNSLEKTLENLIKAKSEFISIVQIYYPEFSVNIENFFEFDKSSVMKQNLTLDEHKVIGNNLKQYINNLVRLHVKFFNIYPKTRYLNFRNALSRFEYWLNQFRSDMEDIYSYECYSLKPDPFTVEVYYGHDYVIIYEDIVTKVENILEELLEEKRKKIQEKYS